MTLHTFTFSQDPRQELCENLSPPISHSQARSHETKIHLSTKGIPYQLVQAGCCLSSISEPCENQENLSFESNGSQKFKTNNWWLCKDVHAGYGAPDWFVKDNILEY